MHEGVSDILVARARELDGFGRPMTASFAVHVGLIVALALLPSAWLQGEPPPKMMTISLGSGAIGPEPNGMSALAGRKVEEVAPPAKRPEPVPTASAKSTAMVEPVKTTAKTPPKPPSATPPRQAAPATKPLTGAQVTQGNAVAETSAMGLGAALSSGGLGGIQVDADFCCKAYLKEMLGRLDERWTPPPGATREAIVEFVVERNGSITGVGIAESSGNAPFDLAAQRAVLNVRLTSLPSAFTEQRMMIKLRFPATR